MPKASTSFAVVSASPGERHLAEAVEQQRLGIDLSAYGAATAQSAFASAHSANGSTTLFLPDRTVVLAGVSSLGSQNMVT
jgi:hypothetical protein